MTANTMPDTWDYTGPINEEANARINDAMRRWLVDPTVIRRANYMNAALRAWTRFYNLTDTADGMVTDLALECANDAAILASLVGSLSFNPPSLFDGIPILMDGWRMGHGECPSFPIDAERARRDWAQIAR